MDVSRAVRPLITEEMKFYQAPRSWAEKAYPKLIYYKSHDRG
jgi:hypothetical protein